MHYREENALENVLQTITQSEVNVTIAKGPDHFSTQLILQTLDIVTLIPGDVIGQPIHREAETIIGFITHAEETTNVCSFQLRITMPMFIVGMLGVLMMIILSMFVVMIVMVIVMVVIIVP